MQLEVGAVLEGKVTGITKFGAFVELPGGKTGMVHISEVAPTFVKEIRDFVQENQTVKVKVLAITDDGKVSLSMKRVEAAPAPRRPVAGGGRPGGYEWSPRRNDNLSFEEMMNKFKQSSDEKLSDLKKYIDPKRGNVSRRVGTK
ncbi:S1 RNA-binding domain-containing protein [Ethanoligenens harbinense]|uniref:RNA binding S1 domain protein n=1 Tax=Ethanoligenens harbinense (strain DSM 18485 / JCM 12961 / CGMCC 1.5033 / YUAN-3) TaxID=663278 RepID=E6U807_ETHHY|nr:S1 RNA-binding domain-containing protein [Ethanoligenens harbinense]ADU25939.1 RNA binding S1 domain protein [Ethanoligenens harbinense YUAN-3]AVQ95091.1 RNA-binding protein S1 [Ethanoligenens harbinense YUAN-3]AYF37782.1 RNA-binding protein S1 [Ethanoligenens harbinense]AYF40504.1 RNA-binding protein S1 [Ethanoligenens harbinense]QCN91337.1 RNA-binding protein S1 [Ethanoligenens harbinense]